MKKTLIRLIVPLLAASATLSSGAGCAGPALEQRNTNNGAYVVDYLFTHDGCRVYRFKERGTSHYFVRCDGPAPSGATMSPQSCGKNCILEEVIPSS